jgi:hypothetical protein
MRRERVIRICCLAATATMSFSNSLLLGRENPIGVENDLRGPKDATSMQSVEAQACGNRAVEESIWTEFRVPQ